MEESWNKHDLGWGIINSLSSFYGLLFEMKIFFLHSVPQESSVPNGIKCPACYNVYDVSCDPVLLACTGTETKRVEVIGIGTTISTGFLVFIFSKDISVLDIFAV